MGTIREGHRQDRFRFLSARDGGEVLIDEQALLKSGKPLIDCEEAGFDKSLAAAA